MSVYLLMLLVYGYLALIVAVLGRRTRLGFWRSLGLSLLITPVLALVVLFVGFEARPSRRQQKKQARLQAAAGKTAP